MLEWLMNWLHPRKKKHEYTYFISYFRPRDGFFNMVLTFPGNVDCIGDVRTMELALMGGNQPESEEDVVVIMNLVLLEKKEVLGGW